MKKEIQDLEKILEVYAVAERREKAAYDFYVEAAEKVAAEEAKQVLLNLAAFEMQHLKMMKNNYEKTLKQIQELQGKS